MITRRRYYCLNRRNGNRVTGEGKSAAGRKEKHPCRKKQGRWNLVGVAVPENIAADGLVE